MGSPVAIAIGAHPDDIEFYMAGTLLLLKAAGYQTHYFNVAGGNCGSTRYNATETAARRKREARAAAAVLGAHFHPSVARDLEIFYDLNLLRRVAGVLREVKPTIVLTHSPQDYMEDHMNTSRLAVTAAFARGMPNFQTQPRRTAVAHNVAVYHAMPHGLRDELRRRVMPGAFVNTASVHAKKHDALAQHHSQQEWLNVSQGLNSCLQAMDQISRDVGSLSKKFKHAEGWRRHSHLGFSDVELDPLREALGRNYLSNASYEKALQKGL